MGESEEGVHGRGAGSEVRIEQIGRRCDDPADKEDWHPTQHRNQRRTDQRAENGGNDAEEFRGNGHIVQRVPERIEVGAQVEGIGKRAPDCIREPVGQRQREDEDRPPAEPGNQLHQRIEDRPE